MAYDEQQIQSLIDAQLQQQPIPLPTMPRASPNDGTRPGWLGLLGEALGGGQSPGYSLRGREADAAGSKALLNFGINMLLASGPQRTKPDLLSAAATGLQGAQQSLGADQQAAQAAAQGRYAEQLAAAKFGQQQQANQTERLKSAIPLLQLQQKNAELAALKGGTTTPTTATAGTGTTPLQPFVAKNLPAGVTPEEDQLVRTVIGEAGGETPEGQAAVAHVIRNRVKGSGQSVQDVIFTPNAFTPWNTAARAKLEGISPTDPQYQQILNSIIRPVMQGALPDPTGGATHFYAPKLQAANKDKVPDWATGTPAATIGGHQFYKAGYGPQKPAGTQVAGGSPGVVTTPPAATPAAGGFQFVPPAGPAYSPDLPSDILANYQRRMAQAATPEEYHKAAQELATAQQKQAHDAATLIATERDRQQKEWSGQLRPATDADLKAQGVDREQNVVYTIDNNGKLSMAQTPLDPRIVHMAEMDQKAFQTQYADKYHSILKMRPILNEMESLLHRVEADPKSGSGGIGAEYARKVNGVLVSLGLASPQLTEAHGAQEAYSALANSLTLAMKSGISMGSVSDRDLAFLEANTPGLVTSPAGRRLLMGGLRQMWDYQERLYDLAAETIRKRPHTLEGFSDKVRALPDAIPLAPDPSSSPAALQAWKEQYKPRVGQTVYRDHTGQMRVWGQS
jgi:spore germination cell wall hydrolase CwlJ-like protein